MKNYNTISILAFTICLSLHFVGCIKKDECKDVPAVKYTYIPDSLRDDLYCGKPGILKFKNLDTDEIVGFSNSNDCQTTWNIGYRTVDFTCSTSSKLEMYGHHYRSKYSTLGLYYCYRQLDEGVVFRYEFSAFGNRFVGAPGLRISQLPRVNLWIEGKEYKDVSLMVSKTHWGNDTLWYHPSHCVLKAHISMTGERFERQF
jgi:hypothetical protein